MYWIRWWIAGLIAWVYTLAFFRNVEVVGSVSKRGPQLIVANHFGGLVDAIVVVRAIGGLPHIVAKSTLFKRLPARLVLKLLGVVPVYRRADHVDVTKNVSSFDEVAKVLVRGRSVLIFPEGTVTDTQELQTIRTGAARMAMTALEQGAEDLTIVPLGITYEDKISSRSRVLVETGEAITTDDIERLAGDGPIEESNRDLVHATTSLIRERLSAVAPDYGSLIRERAMMLAAAVHVRTAMTDPFAEPRMSDLRRDAQALARSSAFPDGHDLAALGRYEIALGASGLEDDQIQPTPNTGRVARVALLKLVAVIVLAPFALFGLLANLVPILLVAAVGAFVKEPVSKGTARILAGLVLFPLAWLVLILLSDPDRVWLTILALVVGLIALVVLVRQLVELFEAAISWWSVRSHAFLLPDLARMRREVEAELEKHLASVPTD